MEDVSVTHDQVRKQAKRSRRERDEFVGSTPTLVNQTICKSKGLVVQRQRRLRDVQETAGSIPAEINPPDGGSIFYGR